MKVTSVSLRPTNAAEAAGRPALTPELLAATGARYSRNNEGLDAILAKIDPNNLDKSVDGIFKMIDYGHASIADMAPVAMFLDGISIWLAYLVWTQASVAGGQESSTRYVKLSREGLIEPGLLGIPEGRRSEWLELMESAMHTYEQALAAFDELGQREPVRTRIPASLLADSSEKAQKQVARMRRNYAFDRARYFLPVALSTNVMLVMSARAWVQLCQWLCSHPNLEAARLGEAIAAELEFSTPRLLKHASAKPSFVAGHQAEFEAADWAIKRFGTSDEATAASALAVFWPTDLGPSELAEALKHHDNRYAYFGEALKRTSVRFSWQGMAIAEIRDLNRHRTGSKFCPALPIGFYCAMDEADTALRSQLMDWSTLGQQANNFAMSLHSQGSAAFPYAMLLGSQLYFEHTTTADKFLYEAELRTGVGAHYRYAQHLRDALEIWYEKVPLSKGMVLEGSAEPE